MSNAWELLRSNLTREQGDRVLWFYNQLSRTRCFKRSLLGPSGSEPDERRPPADEQASSLEIQRHCNVDSLLRKQVVKLGAAQVIEKIGGRGRDRTGGPLLAKQVLSQ